MNKDPLEVYSKLFRRISSLACNLNTKINPTSKIYIRDELEIESIWKKYEEYIFEAYMNQLLDDIR
jgi:hypothetical protein